MSRPSTLLRQRSPGLRGWTCRCSTQPPAERARSRCSCSSPLGLHRPLRWGRASCRRITMTPRRSTSSSPHPPSGSIQLRRVLERGAVVAACGNWRRHLPRASYDRGRGGRTMARPTLLATSGPQNRHGSGTAGTARSRPLRTGTTVPLHNNCRSSSRQPSLEPTDVADLDTRGVRFPLSAPPRQGNRRSSPAHRPLALKTASNMSKYTVQGPRDLGEI